MKKLLVFLLILAVAGGLMAQEAGEWSVAGWVRANGSLDLTSGTGKLAGNDGPIDNGDPTGLEVNLSYKKGDFTTKLFAGLTQTGFQQAGINSWAGINGTWDPDGDWSAYAELGWDPEATNDGATYAKLSMTNWNQDANQFGLKANATFGILSNTFGGSPLQLVTLNDFSSFSGSGLFVAWYDNKIIAETGFGDYTGEIWSPTIGLDYQGYEEYSDADSVVRIQAKNLIEGLNFGLAWGSGFNPFTTLVTDTTSASTNGHNGDAGAYENAADFFRDVTIGAKYAVDPLTVAFTLNLDQGTLVHNTGTAEDGTRPHYEKAVLSGAYKITDEMTAKLEVDAYRLFNFSKYGELKFAESFVYSADPLEIGITLKEIDFYHKGYDWGTEEGFDWKDSYFAVDTLYAKYNILENICAQLSLNLTKGVGKDYGYAEDDNGNLKNTPVNLSWWIQPGVWISVDGTKAANDVDSNKGFYIAWRYGKTTYNDWEDDNGNVLAKASKDSTINVLDAGFKVSF